MTESLNEHLLDERLAKLEAARSWSPRLLSKLENHVRSARDEALFRINPFTFARDRNAPEKEVIDLFLHATAVGLFGVEWALFCPQCCCVVESLRSLRSVHNHYRCSFCQIGYEAALDDYIAVSFTISREIREIAFHHPERLSAWDNFFKVKNTPDGVLPDGTPFRDAKANLARLVSYLPPQQTTNFDIEVSEGTILGASPEGKAALLFSVTGSAPKAAQVRHVRYDRKVDAFTSGEVAAGTVSFQIENRTSEQGMFVVAVVPPDVEVGDAPISFLPFLTGKRLLTTQAFRDLFRSEVIKASEGIACETSPFSLPISRSRPHYTIVSAT